MKPFAPARVVGTFPGGAVIAEREPFAFGAVASYRAVEVTRGGPQGDPDRAASALQVRRVVVREPHEFVTSEEHFLDLFQRSVAEYAAMADTPAPRVRHALGRDGQVRAAVTDHVEGAPLDSVLAGLAEQGRLLPVEVAVDIAGELAALWHLPRRRGVPLGIHLGPAEVWITPEGRVRATPELSSELARMVAGAAVHTFAGNVAYVSPEEISGFPNHETGGMFTLGLLLYELLTNAHPFAAQTMFELLSRLRGEDLPPLASRRAVPASVAAFVHRAVRRDPSQRWSSWEELAAALRELRTSLPATGPAELLAALPTPPPREPAIKPCEVTRWGALPSDGLVPVRVRSAVRRPAAPTPPQAQAARLDPQVVYAGHDGRPMRAAGALLIDVRPVTCAELLRFVAATGGVYDPPVATDAAATGVSIEQAQAYAAWAGKRLPSEDEWAAAVSELGAAPLAIGQVWEWTNTLAHEGHVVRGGRWRDVPERPPVMENRSFETGPAPDVGFRCICARLID